MWEKNHIHVKVGHNFLSFMAFTDELEKQIFIKNNAEAGQ